MTDRANIERWQINVRRAGVPLFFAQAPTSVPAHVVDHLFSFPVNGIRYYAFAWEGAQQHFLQYSLRATACENPFPKED